jgi:hypothetical protein
MPLQNFMAADLQAVLVGFCLFAVIVVPLGYAVGRLTNALQFRSRTAVFQLVSSIPLSIAIGPIFCYTVGRWFSLDAVIVVYVCLAVYWFYSAVWQQHDKLLFSFRRFWRFFALLGTWILLAVLSLIDLRIGKRLYFSVIAFDYAVRTAFTQAISTGGIPAQNPFFFPGHDVGLRYHYFWIALCGLIHRLAFGLVDARQAFTAGTIWCGIGLICLIPLYLHVFQETPAKLIERKSAICILLLGVTGLDLFPALLMVRWESVGFVQGISPSVEWWNNQVDGWLYTMLWEPHYVCAVIACFTGFLILWDLKKDASLGARLACAATAGAAFASGVGSGIYVTFVFAAFLAVWAFICLAKKWYQEAVSLALAGFAAFTLSAPYLMSLRSSAGSSQGNLLQFTVRSFDLGEMFLKIAGFGRPWQLTVGNAVLLPMNYFLEFGFFFAVAVILLVRFRRAGRPATRPELAGFALFAVSTLICTFVKSGVITNNDLGWRGFLIAQFVLLLWGGEVISCWNQQYSQRMKVVLGSLIAIGAAGVAYDLAILRFFPLLSDQGIVPKIGWLAADNKLGLRTYANREAYEWLRAHTSAKALVQQNPKPIYQDTFFGLYGQRQTVAADDSCGTTFGGDVRECRPLVAELVTLFAATGSEILESTCRAMPVNYFVAKDTDEAWANSTSWVWQQPASFANNFVRLFSCEAIRNRSPSIVPLAPGFPKVNPPLDTSGVYFHSPTY